MEREGGTGVGGKGAMSEVEGNSFFLRELCFLVR